MAEAPPDKRHAGVDGSVSVSDISRRLWRESRSTKPDPSSSRFSGQQPT
ncbi:hypothetical protein CGRA01v4_11019 [Colletotrichum graminicola]|nr:hypothetical protein CGRA01v4_11019 [Colletotrichum graminicola]